MPWDGNVDSSTFGSVTIKSYPACTSRLFLRGEVDAKTMEKKSFISHQSFYSNVVDRLSAKVGKLTVDPFKIVAYIFAK